MLGGRPELLSDDFADNIISYESDAIELIRDSVVQSNPPHLRLSYYEHINNALTILKPYLRQSLVDGRRGVNVFLYGKPGTGKTQLAKVMALELGCQLFEIACEDSEGDSIDGENRLRAFCAAQCFFAQRRTLLLFDEVEDVFFDGDCQRRSTAQQRKAWMNRTLEENPVPTIWISNSWGLDPAFVRRFEVVFELPIPPRSQRQKITREACPDLLTEAAVAHISDSEALAPAVITRASSVVRSIRQELEKQEIAPAIEFLVSSTLQAQGHAPIRKSSATRSAVYDPAFIHADTDLGQLSAQAAYPSACRAKFATPDLLRAYLGR
jgi:transitional endoplasmic reticulum ATPase